MSILSALKTLAASTVPGLAYHITQPAAAILLLELAQEVEDSKVEDSKRANTLEWCRQRESDPLSPVKLARSIDQLLVTHRDDCRSAVLAGWHDGWGHGYAKAHREAKGQGEGVKGTASLDDRKAYAATDMGFDNSDDLEAFLHNRGLRIVEGEK